MAKKKKGKKKRVSIASIALILIGSGALAIEKGNTFAGVVLIVLGLACLLMVKYVEE